MSSEEIHTGAKGKEDEKDEFYDCQETLANETRHANKRDNGEGQTGIQVQEEQEDRLQGDEQQEELCDRLRDSCLQEEQGDRSQDGGAIKEQRDGELDSLYDSLCSDALTEDGLQDNKPLVEFDDEYRMELEKDLTEEEKQSRREESLALKEKGNIQFKERDYSAANTTYTEALGLCPVFFQGDRSVLLSNRAAARIHLDMKDQAVTDCSKALDLNPDYLRARLRRAELNEQTEKLDEALEDYKKVLEQDPNHPGARQACMRLPQQIHERNEKMKEEMMGKLKDLGNMILKPFGLSTNNFQVNQDQSGSYSVNFVQNQSKK